MVGPCPCKLIGNEKQSSDRSLVSQEDSRNFTKRALAGTSSILFTNDGDKMKYLEVIESIFSFSTSYAVQALECFHEI